MTAGGGGTEAYRLPRTVEPETYHIEIEPNVASATFSGTLAIDAVVHEPIDVVVMNAAELVVSDVEIRTADGDALACAVHFDDDLEQVSFRPSAALPTGPCVITCRFSGTLNDKLRGFYRSTYTGPDGEIRTMATTQFESVDARRAFPCFDEPDRKAVFDVTLTVDADVEAISNSPVVATESMGEKRRIRFSPTMKMSTYLVAFVIGQLESTETIDVDGVPLRVVTTPGKSALGTYALEVGAFALRFFTEYFDIPYPGEKVDLVAIPDFAAGAMENLGCITFRDTALLVNPDEASRTELERVADVISHELAHMWFGDLVTMGWWEGIWLNEAFATFMEMLCVDAFRPSWDRWVGFAPSREAALAIDAVHSTRPIEYPVGPPKEAEGMFDLLTYEKGASVLRMLEQHIGAEVFRRRRARLSEGTCVRQHGDDRPVGRPRGCERRTGARRDEHLHPPGRAPAALPARAMSCASSRSHSGLCRPAPPRRSGPHGRCRLPCGPSRPTGRPGAPTRNLILDDDPVTLPEAGRDWPWSTPAAGASSAWATRPHTAWPWPSTCPS